MADDATIIDNDPDAPSGRADSFVIGQFSMLHKSVRNNVQVSINVRDNHKVRLHHSHSFMYMHVFSSDIFLSIFLCLFPLLI